MDALITLQLNSALVPQLQEAVYEPWAQGTSRIAVTDLIKIENGHVIINPNSNKELGTGEICIFNNGAKQAIYGAFSLILNEYVVASVGEYALKSNHQVAYEAHATMWLESETKGWLAFHRMDGKYVAFELPETGDAIETMRLRLTWLNMIIKGAYIDINVEQYAPQLYNYFSSLLAMNTDDAIVTIAKHKINKDTKRIEWKRAEAAAPIILDSYKVDGLDFTRDQMFGMKKIFAKLGEIEFSAGTINQTELNHVAHLLSRGYTLSRSI